MAREEKIIARKQREWYPGAIYHVMERGIRRGAIYEDEGDYQAFLAIMKSAQEKYGYWKCSRFIILHKII